MDKNLELKLRLLQNLLHEFTSVGEDDARSVRRLQEETSSLLKELTNELETEKAKSAFMDNALDTWLEGADKKLQSCRAAFRRAVVRAKPILDRAQRKELMESSFMKDGKQMWKRGVLSEEEKTQDITRRLERLRRTLAEELQRAGDNMATIDEGSASLRDTHQEHFSYGNAMTQASSALQKLRKMYTSDRYVIGSAILLFFLVIVFILYRRLPHFGLPYILRAMGIM